VAFGSGCVVLTVQQEKGRPRSRFYGIADRIARRFEPQVSAAFLTAVDRLQRQIDRAELLQAVASRDPGQVSAAVIGASGSLGNQLARQDLEGVFLRTANATGTAGLDVLEDVTGLASSFNQFDPRTVLFARDQAGTLIVQLSDDVREAVRIVLAVGSGQGLTTVQQARAIREIVGLPPNWVRAPLNLGQELREGRFTATRRLSAVDKARIRKRLANGTMAEAFIEEMEGKYRQSLLNRRAQNIARTETLRSSHHGQHIGWKQAVEEGVLPSNVRRAWVVTPDDRLEHGEVPGMNRGGRGMDEMFDTPEGAVLNPPSRPNCRCGIGLIFPGRPGVL